MHAVIGMSGEVGELASAIEKWIWYGQLFDKKNMCEELGDLLWYIAEACTALGDVSLETIMIANIRKLRVRYPEKYSDERALEENRDRKAEAKATEELDELDKSAGFVFPDESVEQTGQGWSEPPEIAGESLYNQSLETLSTELNDRFERNLKYGFDVARQIVDTYLTERDSRLALEFIKESEGRCRAES